MVGLIAMAGVGAWVGTFVVLVVLVNIIERRPFASPLFFDGVRKDFISGIETALASLGLPLSRPRNSNTHSKQEEEERGILADILEPADGSSVRFNGNGQWIMDEHCHFTFATPSTERKQKDSEF